MYLKTITAPTVEPITLIEVKRHLRIYDDTSFDTELTAMITRAREYAEENIRRALAPQTLEYGIDDFPSEEYLNLPMPPLNTITSVKTLDRYGNETTLTATTQYLVDVDQTPGRIVLPYSVAWPTNADYPVNPIKIRYTAGYTTLPEKLKMILLYHIGLMWCYKEDIPQTEQVALDRMYSFWRVRWWGV